MAPAVALLAEVPEIEPGYAVATVTGASLVGSALLSLGRELHSTRRPQVIGPVGVGTLAVCGQLALAESSPAARVVFLLGIVGGWCWYVGWLRSERQTLAEQSLAVGGLLWVGGTITLAVSFDGPGWPVGWSLAAGVVASAVTALFCRLSRKTDGTVLRVGKESAPVAGIFVAPAAVGWLFGGELLFVLFLISAVTVLLGWSLVRLTGNR